MTGWRPGRAAEARPDPEEAGREDAEEDEGREVVAFFFFAGAVSIFPAPKPGFVVAFLTEALGFPTFFNFLAPDGLLLLLLLLWLLLVLGEGKLGSATVDDTDAGGAEALPHSSTIFVLDVLIRPAVTGL